MSISTLNETKSTFCLKLSYLKLNRYRFFIDKDIRPIKHCHTVAV